MTLSRLPRPGPDRISGTFLATLFGLGLTASLWSCGGDPPDIERVTIVSPGPGSVVFTNRLVNVFAVPEPWGDDALPVVDARLIISGADSSVTVAQGDLRSLNALNRIAAIWDPRAFEPGAYTLELTVGVGGDEFVTEADVELRDPPQFSGSVLSSRPVDGAIAVQFGVEAQTAAPAQISSFRWDFGDGSDSVITDEPTVEHVYRELGTTVTVTLNVDDTAGGADVEMYVVSIPTRPIGTVILQAAQTCGCRQMTIINQVVARSRRYCAPGGVPPIPGLAAVAGAANPPCPPGQTAFTGALGPRNPPPTLGHGFEVEAILQPGSTPAACTEGQYVMNTFTAGGAVVQNPNTPQAPPAGNITLPAPAGGAAPFTFTGVASPAPGAGAPVAAPPFVAPPAVGPAPLPVFGADDYDAPSSFKEHAGLVIRWLDMPQGATAGAAATMNSEFVSFVQGATGTCWCDFRLNRTVNAAGAAGGVGITLVQGLNCRVR